MVFSDSRWLGRPSLCMVVGSEIPLIFHVLVLRSCRSLSGCTILTSCDFLTDPKLLGKILLCWSSVYIFFVEHESEIAWFVEHWPASLFFVDGSIYEWMGGIGCGSCCMRNFSDLYRTEINVICADPKFMLMEISAFACTILILRSVLLSCSWNLACMLVTFVFNSWC